MSMTTETKPKTTKPRYRPSDVRRGKPFVVAIADTEQQRNDLYFGVIVERLIRKINERREYDRTRYQPQHRASFANLSRATGIPYNTLDHYLIKRDRKLDIKTLDKILWAMNLSLLDLIEPREFVSYAATLSTSEIDSLRTPVKNLVDKLRASE